MTGWTSWHATAEIREVTSWGLLFLLLWRFSVLLIKVETLIYLMMVRVRLSLSSLSNPGLRGTLSSETHFKFHHLGVCLYQNSTASTQSINVYSRAHQWDYIENLPAKDHHDTPAVILDDLWHSVAHRAQEYHKIIFNIVLYQLKY